MLNWQLELCSKNPDLNQIQTWLIVNPEEIPFLIENLKSNDDLLRHNAFLLTQKLARENGQLLYPFWQLLAEMLSDSNNFFRSIAIHILAKLCAVDQENQFELIKDDYFALLLSGCIMTIRTIVLSIPTIFLSKPALRPDLLERLFHIEKYVNVLPERVDLIKNDILITFESIRVAVSDKNQMLTFAKNAMDAQSPKTKNQAKRFLKKYSSLQN